MTLHSMPFGAQVDRDGVRFSLYAPTAGSVELLLDGGAPRPMAADDRGLYALHAGDARAGGRYRFRVDGSLVVPDPASRFQPDGIDADGLVVDPTTYKWRNTEWRGRPWREAVIWEAHVGTATPEGTYRALAARLPELASLGVTAVELMPIADCPGARNWGYDGVLPYAPNNAYGTPDDLRAFVDEAHGLGLMVMLDVVYNHFGPAGNYLHAYAKSFFTERHPTPWGAGINVDGEHSELVRAFFVHNALYWIEEFGMDGLRLDAVHAIRDDSGRHILAEIADAVHERAQGRHVHLVLENETNSARWLERVEGDRPRFYTAQWNDDIHHCLHVLLTGETDAYYADFADDPLGRLGRGLAQGFVYQGERSPNLGHSRGEPSSHLPPTAFVSFLQNHDQVGNRALGDRIAPLTTPDKLAFAHAVLLLAPQIPMLFMGEEWDASSPFQFFVDFSDDPALSVAVREGRRKEFARFAAFADPERVPDPTAVETFQRSKLNWDEAHEGEHARSRAVNAALLKIRAAEIVPLLATPFEGADWRVEDGSLQVEWRFGGGELRMVANAGDRPQTFGVEEGWRVIYGDATGSVAPWTCLFAVRAARD